MLKRDSKTPKEMQVKHIKKVKPQSIAASSSKKIRTLDQAPACIPRGDK